VSAVDAAVEAIRGGRLAVVPTDTVYGLATSPYSEAPVRRLYRAKGRDELQPTALVAADLDVLFECIPELHGRAGAIARALLPGPFTLILPNPGHRFRWLTGSSPETIGVRVPELAGPGGEVLARVGAVAATSANLPGAPDPRTLDEVPPELRAAADALVDGGELAGTPSTVIDFTGPDPVVLREGAASAADALRAVGSVL
jgi:tRNA threonylcarbamoyl adenosine modification protein (Sua5/YciO/YrdC/YwlC family)